MPLHTRMKTQVFRGLLWLCLLNFGMVVSIMEPEYLDFDNLPDTNFSCVGKVIGGYYADLETSCQMFHVCTIGQLDEPMDIRFLCLNGTVFDQETRVCERVDEVDCSKAEKFYHLNLELYGNTAPPILEEPESTPAPPRQTTSTTPRTTTTPRTIRTTYLPSTTTHHVPKVVDNHQFSASNGPDIRFNPEEINIRLTPGSPPIIKPSAQSVSFQQQAYSGAEPRITITTHTSVYNNNNNNNNNRLGGTSSTLKPKPLVNYGLQHTPKPSYQHNYDYSYQHTDSSDLDYNTDVPSHSYSYHDHNLGQFEQHTNLGSSITSNSNNNNNNNHNKNYQKTNNYVPTTKSPEQVYSSSTPFSSSLTASSLYQYQRTDKPSLQIPQSLIPTLPPLTFSSPAPFSLTRHFDQKRSNSEHHQPPRIIVSASASVSDASGRRLNYSLGQISPTHIIGSPPATYDEYREEDVGLDPFYHDVPKINKDNKRHKREVHVDDAKKDGVTHWIPPDYVDDNYEPLTYDEHSNMNTTEDISQDKLKVVIVTPTSVENTVITEQTTSTEQENLKTTIEGYTTEQNELSTKQTTKDIDDYTTKRFEDTLYDDYYNDDLITENTSTPILTNIPHKNDKSAISTDNPQEISGRTNPVETTTLLTTESNTEPTSLAVTQETTIETNLVTEVMKMSDEEEDFEYDDYYDDLEDLPSHENNNNKADVRTEPTPSSNKEIIENETINYETKGKKENYDLLRFRNMNLDSDVKNDEPLKEKLSFSPEDLKYYNIDEKDVDKIIAYYLKINKNGTNLPSTSDFVQNLTNNKNDDKILKEGQKLNSQEPVDEILKQTFIQEIFKYYTNLYKNEGKNNLNESLDHSLYSTQEHGKEIIDSSVVNNKEQDEKTDLISEQAKVTFDTLFHTTQVPEKENIDGRQDDKDKIETQNVDEDLENKNREEVYPIDHVEEAYKDLVQAQYNEENTSESSTSAQKESKITESVMDDPVITTEDIYKTTIAEQEYSTLSNHIETTTSNYPVKDESEDGLTTEDSFYKSTQIEISDLSTLTTTPSDTETTLYTTLKNDVNNEYTTTEYSYKSTQIDLAITVPTTVQHTEDERTTANSLIENRMRNEHFEMEDTTTQNPTSLYYDSTTSIDSTTQFPTTIDYTTQNTDVTLQTNNHEEVQSTTVPPSTISEVSTEVVDEMTTQQPTTTAFVPTTTTNRYSYLRTREPYWKRNSRTRPTRPRHRFSSPSISMSDTVMKIKGNKKIKSTTETMKLILIEEQTNDLVTDSELSKSASPTEAKNMFTPTTPLTKTIFVARRFKLESKKGFNCINKELNKYYEDPRDCRLFHYCTPGYSQTQVLDMKFVCDFGTYFDVEKLICTKNKPQRCK